MVEIASIIELVLSKAESAPITSGKNAGKLSRAKHTLDQAVRNQARARVNVLLERFPVYPGLDLAFLQEHFQSSHVETKQIHSAPREPYIQIVG
jgi:glycine hydroxymethyltransferase